MGVPWGRSVGERRAMALRTQVALLTCMVTATAANDHVHWSQDFRSDLKQVSDSRASTDELIPRGDYSKKEEAISSVCLAAKSNDQMQDGLNQMQDELDDGYWTPDSDDEEHTFTRLLSP